MNRTLRPGTLVAVICAIVAVQESARRVLIASDLLRPPATLAETGLYADEGPGVIASSHRPFSPQYPLWSDGAAKRRWVYLPPGAAIDATDRDHWDFPVGTRFWKEFSIGGRRVETRLLWKASADRWVFASYAWNEAQTAATLAPSDGLRGVAPLPNGRRHDIPSIDECRACHDAKRTEVLGFNALQLSDDRDPGAIHGEPLEPAMVTLKELVQRDLLTPRRPELVAQPPRIDGVEPATRSALGYLVANCGHCHNRDTAIAQLGPSLKHSDVVADPRGTVAALRAHRTDWQVPGAPEGASVLVDPEDPARSALLVRMRSRRPSSQMPPVGTAIRDERGIAALAQWIAAASASR